MHKHLSGVLTLGLTFLAGLAFAQTSSVPLYSVTIEAGTTKVISYRHLSGATKIDFRGTPLSPETKGEATVKSGQGAIQIDARFENLQAANKFGPEYLTYVLWSISPEGRATNLGELILKDSKSNLRVTTQLQAFGLIVTAEPYYAVTQVGNVVVLENTVRKDTKGQVEQLDAKYDLLQRGQYSLNRSPADLQPVKLDRKIPFYVYQARNAVNIAKAAGAETVASDTFKKAQTLLAQAEDNLVKRKNRKLVPSIAREAIQTAEDARLITAKRTAEKAVSEKLSQAEAAVKSAEAQRMQATSDAEKAKADAATANAVAARAEEEKSRLRAQLRNQLNAILETRDSARGLIVNMSDVLFSIGKYDLKPNAREKLAKVAGIVLSHPGLRLEVEGHTDNVGTDEYNQQLSEKRAGAVRDYLIQQGMSTEVVVARGFGETTPIATNETGAGRKQNRRVEIIVSGEQIGTQLSRLSIE